MSLRLPARSAYLVYAGGSALAFACYRTLASVYQVETARLDALQLVLVGTALETAVFLFEVPTGVVADSVSRRLSVVVGMLLIGLGFLLEGWVPRFGPILLAQLVWGVGSTFESGAVDAWISDEIGEAAAADAFLRGTQVAQGAGLVGIGVAALLGAHSLAWPLRAGGIGFVLLAGVLALTMTERGFRPQRREAGRPFAGLRRTLADGFALVGRRPLVRWILVLAVLGGAASEVFDRLWQARVLQFPLPLGERLGAAGVFGVVAAVSMVASIAVAEVVRRRVDGTSHAAVARALMGLTAVLMVAVVAFGVAGDALTALAFYLAAVLVRRVHAPLFRAWLNQSAERATRATLFSFANQMDALGQITGGPLLGLLALRAGMAWAFAACGALLFPALLIYRRSLRRPPGPPPPRASGGTAADASP